jgi:alginate production protein
MKTVTPLCFALAALLPLPAAALTTDWTVKLRAGALAEGDRDLGTDPADEEHNESFLELMPRLHTQFSPDFAHFVRVQGFLPSGMVVENEHDEPVEVEGYAALREFWFDYGGLTDYPGEGLRLGLQRLREYDGLWWDRDIEAVRWIFDTTLFQFQLGAAKQFNAYRTDDYELPETQRDRAYGFMGISTQWIPRNFVGARLAYAVDQRELPPPGTPVEADGGTETDPVSGDTLDTYREPQVRRYSWLGVFLDNRYYEHERGPGVAYRVELIGLAGNVRRADVTDPDTGATGTTGTTGNETREDVEALGGDAGLRVRFGDAFPLVIGGGYAYGQGGRDTNGSREFRQTGLHSNRSRFTGTRTILNRFNEAYQADLNNLRVATAFVALPLANWDLSLVAHRFERDDPNRGVSADGVDVQPLANGSADLGTGFDVVLTRHFDRVAQRLYTPEDDIRSNLRLRASQFSPGEAYGTQLDDLVRIVLEGTLWF